MIIHLPVLSMDWETILERGKVLHQCTVLQEVHKNIPSCIIKGSGKEAHGDMTWLLVQWKWVTANNHKWLATYRIDVSLTKIITIQFAYNDNLLKDTELWYWVFSIDFSDPVHFLYTVRFYRRHNVIGHVGYRCPILEVLYGLVEVILSIV